jgi:hypothetical protein
LYLPALGHSTHTHMRVRVRHAHLTHMRVLTHSCRHPHYCRAGTDAGGIHHDETGRRRGRGRVSGGSGGRGCGDRRCPRHQSPPYRGCPTHPPKNPPTRTVVVTGGSCERGQPAPAHLQAATADRGGSFFDDLDAGTCCPPACTRTLQHVAVCNWNGGVLARRAESCAHCKAMLCTSPLLTPTPRPRAPRPVPLQILFLSFALREWSCVSICSTQQLQVGMVGLATLAHYHHCHTLSAPWPVSRSVVLMLTYK